MLPDAALPDSNVWRLSDVLARGPDHEARSDICGGQSTTKRALASVRWLH